MCEFQNGGIRGIDIPQFNCSSGNLSKIEKGTFPDSRSKCLPEDGKWTIARNEIFLNLKQYRPGTEVIGQLFCSIRPLSHSSLWRNPWYWKLEGSWSALCANIGTALPTHLYFLPYTDFLFIILAIFLLNFMHWTVHDRCSNQRLKKKGEISSIFQQLVFWKILMAFYSDVWIKIDIKLKRILKWITLHNS